MEYQKFFQKATGNPPYDYQVRLAEADPWPDLLEAPTGAGKTEAIVLAWLWRRRYASPAVRATTPRRLAYTLPMRVLVEQTKKRVHEWLAALGEADNVGVEILMGGETDNDWDLYPEREAVLIGTQDMLLSRALNRGYALGRARWPMPYGLLNNDCLWVFDEVQLMGSGLATTAQLAAFREKFQTWGNCPSLWASATLRPDWLATVDFRERVKQGLKPHILGDTEWNEGLLSERLNAKKVLKRAENFADDSANLVQEILSKHQHGTLTLVVVNRVDKAKEIYKAFISKGEQTPKRSKKSVVTEPAQPVEKPLLLHSQFRPKERAEKMKRLEEMNKTGGIVISTQVVEAGVDISARVMFTEMSPWSSFVQRVGRCNRYGKIPDAQVFWMDLEIDTEKSAAKNAPPYTPDELKAARNELGADALKVKGVGPRALRDHLKKQTEERLKQLYPRPTGEVIRKTDVLGLFNTTADLTGGDIDIARFIREGDERDAQVLWRDFGNDPNSPEQPAAQRDELCPVSVRKLDEFVNPKSGKRKDIYRWDFLEGKWERPEKIVAGQIYLLALSTGGYDPEIGWSPDSKNFAPTFNPQKAKRNNANDKDPDSQDKEWQTLAEHVDEVVDELEAILKPEALGGLVSPEEQAVLRHAARWHDWGKAHTVFQEGLLKAGKLTRVLPDPQVDKWGKSGKSEAHVPDPQVDKQAKPKRYKSNYSRPGFRHELASALGMLALQAEHSEHSDLACYLVAAHHGKVRMLIRSMPNEKRPPDDLLFARGVWENDPLPIANLGGKTTTPAVTLSLEYMKSGVSAIGQPPSWAERVLSMLECYGPFRLAYLETLLCAADRRASAKHGG